MNTNMTPERKLEILEKLFVAQAKKRHGSLEEIGPDIAHVAEEISEKSEDVAAVLVPLYKKAVDDVLAPDAIAKSMEEPRRERRHGH